MAGRGQCRHLATHGPLGRSLHQPWNDGIRDALPFSPYNTTGNLKDNDPDHTNTYRPSSTDGVHLYLLLWKAFKALEQLDLESIRALGFRCNTDFAVLEILMHKGPMPINAIGKSVLLTSGSITTAIDRAERAGWVERRPDQADRRVTLVHLTESGSQRIEKAFSSHRSRMEQVFGHLSGDERERFGYLLKKAGLGVQTGTCDWSPRDRSQARAQDSHQERENQI